MKLFDIFKKKKKIEPIKMVEFEPKENNDKGEKFQCHYCQKFFIIEQSKVFPSNVRSCDGAYFFQGKGYLCPHCQEICIIG